MKSHTEYLVFETRKRREMVHITDDVEQIVRRSGVKDGLCFVSPMHITAADLRERSRRAGSLRTLASGSRSWRQRAPITSTTAPAKTTATRT